MDTHAKHVYFDTCKQFMYSTGILYIALVMWNIFVEGFPVI